MEQAHLQKEQQQQALNAESLHSAGRVKHRMDGMQRNEAPSYLDFVSTQPDPVFDKRRQQSGLGSRKNGHGLVANGALKIAADRYCQVGIDSLIYRPAHPDYLPGGVQFGVDPLHPLQHQSAVRHSKTPRTVFSCRKNGQSSSLDSDSDTEDATEDEFGRRLSSGPSPLEVDDATCRHLSFSAGGATPSGMSGRRRANNA